MLVSIEFIQSKIDFDIVNFIYYFKKYTNTINVILNKIYFFL